MVLYGLSGALAASAIAVLQERPTTDAAGLQETQRVLGHPRVRTLMLRQLRKGPASAGRTHNDQKARRQMSVDPYADPKTGVMLNRLNIRDAAHLSRIEAGVTMAALADLGARILPGDYDLPHLQLFHREIFGDLYPWAGEIRVVRIAKTDLFCLPQYIEANAADLFAALAKERHLRGLPRDRFVDRLTHYLAEVNALHPFREGNGRTQRAFVHQLCREAGWPITWFGLNPDHNDSASMQSLRGDNAPLRDLLDQLVLRNSKAAT